MDIILVEEVYTYEGCLRSHVVCVVDGGADRLKDVVEKFMAEKFNKKDFTQQDRVLLGEDAKPTGEIYIEVHVNESTQVGDPDFTELLFTPHKVKVY